LLFQRDGLTLKDGLVMTHFGAMKHLKVLEDAGLVATRRSGRKKLHFLNAVSIRMIHDRWIDKYREREVSALLALKATDWSATKALESMFPTTEVVPDAIFVGDGHTSPRQASRPASIRRSPSSSRTAAPGSRSTPRESSCSTFGALAASPNSVPAWPHKPTQPTSCVGLLLGSRSTPTGDLSIPALAGRAAMSERTFARISGGDRHDADALGRTREAGSRQAVAGNDQMAARSRS
jgi:hypothetical protein